MRVDMLDRNGKVIAHYHPRSKGLRIDVPNRARAEIISQKRSRNYTHTAIKIDPKK